MVGIYRLYYLLQHGNQNQYQESIEDFISRSRSRSTMNINKWFDVVCSYGHLSAAKLLISFGADIRHNNDVPVYAAISNNNLVLAKYLVSMGANYVTNELCQFEMIFNKHLYDPKFHPNCVHVDMIEYLVFLGLWHNSLNPYDYLKYLKQDHLQKIDDPEIKRFIRSRYNSINQIIDFSDLIIKLIV